jgi:anhydro-N-acetylmuramic acid kinase
VTAPGAIGQAGHSPASVRHVVGCMTGTSIDALDAALVRVHGHGLGMRAEFVRGVSRTLGELGPRLRAMADQRAMTAGEIAALSRDFALLHAEVVREVLGATTPELVAVHGQTVFHAPPVSWQMFNGGLLAHALGVPVVFDLRAADLAAGGQGAPITPLADWVLLRSDEPTAVVNLGGFCNATVLPSGRTGESPAASIAAIAGYDICACNHLLDTIARELLGRPYDENGRAALKGIEHAPSLDDLRELLSRQSREGRSLGTGDELAQWIDRWRNTVNPNDLAATACGGIGRTIAVRLHAGSPTRVLVAGGGAHNAALVGAIRRATGGDVDTTASRGVPIEFREAMEMGVLGALCRDRVPITLTRVTGVPRPPLAGVWAGV